MSSITIARRFCGPPESANGGYTCGLLAELLGGDAEVTLRSPPPLDLALPVVEQDEALEIRLGDTLVAEARAATLSMGVPAPPTFAEAVDASSRYPWYTGHPYPTCFVCGPDRARGDGLRIFAGPVADRRIAAAPWVPEPSLLAVGGAAADASGAADTLPLRFVFAALDCPSWFGAKAFSDDSGAALLGRFTAACHAPVHVDEEHVVMGWHVETEGRKVLTASALFSADGQLKAQARAVWIKV